MAVTAQKVIRFLTQIQGTQEVQREFENINRSMTEASATAEQKLAPAMDSVEESFEDTGGSAGGLSQLLIGGAGLAAAFAATALVVNHFKGIMEEARKELEDIRGVVQDLIKITTPKGAFNLLPEDMPAALEMLRKELEQIEMISTQSYQMQQAYKGETTALKEAIKILEEAVDKEKARVAIIDLLTKAGFTYTEELKKQTKEIEKQIKLAKGFVEAGSPLMRGIVAGLSASGLGSALEGIGGRSTGVGLGAGMVGVPRKPLIQGMDDFEKEQIKKDEQYQQQFADSFTNILEVNFSTFWEATFGEANSLLEQLLQATFGSIISNIASGFLSFIPGGSIIGGIVSLFDSSSNSNAVNTPVVIQLGGEDVARVVLEGNRVIQQRRLS